MNDQSDESKDVHEWLVDGEAEQIVKVGTFRRMQDELGASREWRKRVMKQGLLPMDGDILGLWLMTALVGKRTEYFTTATGERVEELRDTSGAPYTRHTESNSTEDPFFYCQPSITIRWDQWAEVVIRCQHGEFKGVSDFLNLTEALIRAVVKFNDADHPLQPHEDDAEAGDEAS